MSTQLIETNACATARVRCNAGDAIVANLAVHIVFFF